MNPPDGYRTTLLKKTFWLFTGRAMPVVVLFAITILYARRLEYADYGRFQSIWMYSNLLNVITGFGITSVILSSNFGSLLSFARQWRSKISGAYLVLILITSLVFVLLAKSLQPSTRWLLICFVVVQTTASVLETVLIKIQREKIVFIFNFIYAFFFFGWHYYILSAGFDLNFLVTGIIVLNILKVLAMLFFYQAPNTAIEKGDTAIDPKHWLYLGFNDITGVISRWIDKLLLVSLLTATDFALFFNGSFEIPLFGLLVSVIAGIMLIEMSKKTSAKTEVARLFRESFRLLSLIVFPLFSFLFFFRREIFAVLFRHKYDASVAIFAISIFVLPIRVNNYSSILQYYQQGNKIMIGSLLDICLAAILMIVLYPVMGTPGVALAVVIATYCQVVYYLWQSAKIVNSSFLSLIPISQLVKTMCIALFYFALLYYCTGRLGEGEKFVAGGLAAAFLVLTNLIFYFYQKKSARVTNKTV